MDEKVISMAQWKRKYFEQKQRADDAIRLIESIAKGNCSNNRNHAMHECKHFFQTHKGGDE